MCLVHLQKGDAPKDSVLDTSHELIYFNPHNSMKFVSVINFGNVLDIITSNISPFSLTSPLVFPFCISYIFYNCPTVPRYAVPFYFHWLFSLVSVCQVSMAVSSSSLILSSAGTSLQINPSKAFLISVTVCLNPHIFFWLLISVSSFLFILPIFSVVHY